MINQKTIGVDIGNSAIKTAEFLANELSEVRKWQTLDEVAKEYLRSYFVVSSVTASQEDINAKLKNCLVVTANIGLPLSLNYDTPETLGSDRIAAAVGAWDLFPDTNLLIIDAGTCVTYDLVTADGVYQGGMISPGLDIRLHAMHKFTNGLPLVYSESITSKTDLVGKSTTEGLALGATKGLEFEIQGVLESFNKKYDHLQVVITGGSRLNFESIPKAHIFADSKIVLCGLQAIWKFNEAY